VVGVAVCQQQLADAARVQPVGRDVGDQAVRVASAAGVDQGVLVAAVEQVDVAVEVVGQREAVPPARDDVDPVGDFQGTSGSRQSTAPRA
jgi:hypothetical protein